MKKFINYLIFVIALFSGLILGYSIHKYQPSFYLKIKDKIVYGKVIEDKKRIFNNKFFSTYKTEVFDKKKDYLNTKEFNDFFNLVAKQTFNNFLYSYKDVKNNFIKKNILNDSQISFQNSDKDTAIKIKKNFLPDEIELNKNNQIFEVKYYQHFTYGILHKNLNDSKKLIIYNHGHTGNSYDFDYFNKLKSKYISDGYDILNLNMPVRGINLINNLDISFPVNPYKNILPNYDLKYSFNRTKNHQLYRYFYDSDNPEKAPLSLFLSGNYYLIKKILSMGDYNEVKIIGHSGGGLQSLYYMYLIPEIKSGYFSASFFTKTHRLDSTGGDWEHYYSEYILNETYFNLIYGSLIDEKERFSRKIILQFNSNDPSCCGYPYAENFVGLTNKMGYDLNLNIKSRLIDSNYHKIDLENLYKLF